MTLVAQKSKGVFRNDTWTAGTPGLYAVIIGVSAYERLDGTRRSYGLGQLTVSALTAFRVLSWLERKYEYDDAPLAQCWVLLSPTSAERQYAIKEPGFGDVLAHAAIPTLKNCETAIRSWHGVLESLPKRVATKSRTLFFFSGHGLEFTEERQILLPSDYLTSGVPDDAISVANIRAGCGSLLSRDQFFFIDACRNDHEDLRAANISGARILQDWGSAKLNPDRNSALLYASASGTRAFSPLAPEKGCSIFGQALLEGFVGTPDLHLECDSKRCAITMYPLHKFVQRRVPTLLAANGGVTPQRIPLDGPIVEEPTITYIPAGTIPPPPTAPAAPGDPLGTLPDRLPDAVTGIALPHMNGVSRGELFASKSTPHNAFGSETITASWQEARLFALDERTWADADDLQFYRIRRDEARRVYRAQVSITGSHWLQVTLPEWADAPSTFATVLVDPYRQAPIYELDIYRDADGTFISVDATLALENGGDLGLAARLWQWYRMESPLTAITSPEMTALSKEKPSVLPALVAALVFLRARQELPRWIRTPLQHENLISDAEVLWFEAEGETKYQSDVKVRSLLDGITRLGLPLLNETFGYLDRQVSRIANIEAEELWMDRYLKSRLRAVQEQIATTMRFFRPGGMASTFISGEPAALSPYLILPALRLAVAPPTNMESEGSAGAMTAG